MRVLEKAMIAVLLGIPLSSSELQAQQHTLPSSNAVLARLPDGPIKRQFIIDCTNCHQFAMQQAFDTAGKPRSQAQWVAIVERMLSYAGARTGFPIMSAGRDAEATAAYLASHFSKRDITEPAAKPMAEGRARITEYLLPEPRDLAHDVAVDSAGTILVTGMMTHTMYSLDSSNGTFSPIAIPAERSNPRAIEIAANGDWWVVLGGPQTLARYRPATKEWQLTRVGMYAHSVALDGIGRAWFNGHFSRAPELVGFVDEAGTVTTIDAPLHPVMSEGPGGPIPYELRAAPDGRIWMSELQGNRLLAYSPSSKSWEVHEMPLAISAPRRFDISPDGTLWIPAYAANALYRYNPGTRAFTRYELPERDAVPYIARHDRRSGGIWIGTAASDAVYRFDPATSRYTRYALPQKGAIIRHLVIDPRNGDVWLAYGASPGIPARIARLRIAL